MTQDVTEKCAFHGDVGLNTEDGTVHDMFVSVYTHNVSCIFCKTWYRVLSSNQRFCHILRIWPMNRIGRHQ
jgi:hypothetical protein